MFEETNKWENCTVAFYEDKDTGEERVFIWTPVPGPDGEASAKGYCFCSRPPMKKRKKRP